MPTIEQAREWYRDADPVHDFDHVMRVYHVALALAAREGGDREIIHAAALLHDAVGSAPGSAGRDNHHELSAEFAEKVLQEEGWPAERIAAVRHCIRAHRFRSGGEKPETIEAQLIFDADKLDVLGAIGAVRVCNYAALNGQPAFAEPSERFKASGEKEPGEPHSAYHEHIFKLRNVPARLFTASARQMAAERLAYLDEFFTRLQAELNGEL